ncbi:MAG: MoaD/ThiS family protein [Caulobacterales bacterium]|jgi:molybdopterin synthase sulfur carrier subunit|nr:MoaD/ThiS family protein [Caulobacterales bacterium]
MTRLLFFGRLRDVTGFAERDLELPRDIATIADLRAFLSASDPDLGEAIAARGVRVAVNQSFCLNDLESVCDAREIAFMPPLSGG